jgi:hypothetical protein
MSTIVSTADGYPLVTYNEMHYKLFRAQIDRQDLNHPGEPNLMRTIMCARILRRGDEGHIEVDVS